MNNELATRIFDDIFDDEDLNKMHRSKIIAQPLGFKLSCIATIEVAIDEHCSSLTEENTKLLEALFAAIKFIDSHVADYDITTEMAENYHSLMQLEPNKLLNQLKEQNNDK